MVIFVEMEIVKKSLKCSRIKAFRTCTGANLLSTFVGIPVTWFLCGFLSVPLLGVACALDRIWPGFQGKSDMVISLMFGGVYVQGMGGHMQMFATIFLLIPYYYMSVYIENAVMKRFFPDTEKTTMKKAVVLMNRVTYFMLGGLMLLIFLLGEYYAARHFS